MQIFSKHSPLFILSLSSTFIPEIIKYYGYKCEIHKVTTKDGYILEMHRIPFGRNFNENEENLKQKKPVVYLQHGLLASSFDWVANLPNQSLGFILADAGYDVWMGNVRGNVYSSKHEKSFLGKDEYWKFTWDEMALIDLPAMVDKALEISGQSKLFYVGHSQGTLIMFAQLASDNKEFKNKIIKYFALAPVATIKHMKGLISVSGNLFGKSFDHLNKHFGSHEFMPSNWASQLFAQILCSPIMSKSICDNIMFLIVPIYLYYSDSDWLATNKDVEISVSLPSPTFSCPTCPPFDWSPPLEGRSRGEGIIGTDGNNRIGRNMGMKTSGSNMQMNANTWSTE
uniref:Partial AB-hydrolase lipase domain-containing protein n=1 Tax=Meloidogyne floridensis TaxID=298350 RepID=A0A915P4L9_9BILA